MPNPEKKIQQQQTLFSGIARQYNLVNHLMTGWQDILWRRFAVSRLELSTGGRVLDIGSGNGQIVQEIHRRYPGISCVAGDLTLEMMEVGRERISQSRTAWVGADSCGLPFPDGSFDGVISGFLVRNLDDLSLGLKDQYRILKSGGRIAVLDTTRPPEHILAPVIRFYMNHIIPVIGLLAAGNKTAYQYLNDSTVGFLRAEELAASLELAGFRDVHFRKFAFGMIAVHWGVK